MSLKKICMTCAKQQLTSIIGSNVPSILAAKVKGVLKKTFEFPTIIEFRRITRIFRQHHLWIPDLPYMAITEVKYSKSVLYNYI